jgi:O-antigen ligase
LAYLGLIAFALLASKIDLSKNYRQFFSVVLFGTMSLTTYGLFQNFGLDFIAWSNPYSPVIGTLGNPNFMGAILGVFSLMLIPVIFLKEYTLRSKSIYFSVLAANFFVINFTNALQGFMIFSFGLTLFLILMSFFKYKKFGILGLTIFLFALCFAILGILQKGPFASLLYKSSVSLRGYYWDAGIKMFFEKPIFGVGLDNYGLYFNEVRDVKYSLNYGYFVTSNNAHNLPIQLFATGGFFVGITYLILVAYVLFVSTKKLRKVDPEQKKVLTGITIAYIIFQLQSIVSIDNIGVAIWGWVLAGLIIGFNCVEEISSTPAVEKNRKSQFSINTSSSTTLYSWILVMAATVLIALLYQGEKKTYDLEGILMGNPSAIQTQISEVARDFISTPLLDPRYKMFIAEKLMTAGASDEAMQMISDLVAHEPRNLDYLTVQASFYEFFGNYEMAIKNRIQIAKLNPFNVFNLKLLVDSYLKTSNIQEAKRIQLKIDSFAPNTELANEIKNNIAKSEFGAEN